MAEKGYKKLIAWQKADDLAVQIYVYTKHFPQEEKFGLMSQIRRSAVSVPTNIAEAMGRQTKGESRQFIGIALGSLSETEYLMELSQRLNYLSKSQFLELERIRRETGALLWKLFKSF